MQALSFSQDEPTARSLLRDSVAVLRLAFLPLAAIATAAFGPVLLIAGLVWLLAPTAPGGNDIDAQFALFIGAIVVAFACYQLAASAMTHAVYQLARGREVRPPESLSVGLRSLPRIAWLALVTTALTVLGFVFCVVPGIIAMLSFFCAVPSAVVERTGVRAALDRSASLTEGYRIQVFLAFLAFELPSTVIGRLGEAMVTARAGPELQIAGASIMFVMFLFDLLVVTILHAVSYYRLRSMKEGLDLEEIAAVFD